MRLLTDIARSIYGVHLHILQLQYYTARFCAPSSSSDRSTDRPQRLFIAKKYRLSLGSHSFPTGKRLINSLHRSITNRCERTILLLHNTLFLASIFRHKFTSSPSPPPFSLSIQAQEREFNMITIMYGNTNVNVDE